MSSPQELPPGALGAGQPSAFARPVNDTVAHGRAIFRHKLDFTAKPAHRLPLDGQHSQDTTRVIQVGFRMASLDRHCLGLWRCTWQSGQPFPSWCSRCSPAARSATACRYLLSRSPNWQRCSASSSWSARLRPEEAVATAINDPASIRRWVRTLCCCEHCHVGAGTRPHRETGRRLLGNVEGGRECAWMPVRRQHSSSC
jgi:hypothetical protein